MVAVCKSPPLNLQIVPAVGEDQRGRHPTAEHFFWIDVWTSERSHERPLLCVGVHGIAIRVVQPVAPTSPKAADGIEAGFGRQFSRPDVGRRVRRYGLLQFRGIRDADQQ
jgi:hypothetical protein